MKPQNNFALLKTLAPGGVATSALRPDEQIWFRRKTYMKMALFITTFTSAALTLVFFSS